MTPTQLINALNQQAVAFSSVIAVIESHYHFTPTAFNNGSAHNLADQNQGACKVLAFAQLHQLSPQATLNAFGDFYTQDVLLDPLGDNHQNIRQFMQTGWAGVQFMGEALQPK